MREGISGEGCAEHATIRIRSANLGQVEWVVNRPQQRPIAGPTEDFSVVCEVEDGDLETAPSSVGHVTFELSASSSGPVMCTARYGHQGSAAQGGQQSGASPPKDAAEGSSETNLAPPAQIGAEGSGAGDPSNAAVAYQVSDCEDTEEVFLPKGLIPDHEVCSQEGYTDSSSC